jgi:hypothetical protein
MSESAPRISPKNRAAWCEPFVACEAQHFVRVYDKIMKWLMTAYMMDDTTSWQELVRRSWHPLFLTVFLAA